MRAGRCGTGPLLDAGCGSLVFTSNVYAKLERPLILVDLSLGMLEAARARLIGILGGVPNNIFLLQADLRALPFRSNCFDTVLSMGMIHLFPRLGDVIPELRRVTEPTGELYLTSLVAERMIGRRYLALLHKAGEIAPPRSCAGLLTELETVGLGRSVEIDLKGSMAFMVAQRA